MEETGAKINIPPPSVQSDEIVVSGEKEGVMKCKATILAIYEEKVKHRGPPKSSLSEHLPEFIQLCTLVLLISRKE